MNDLWKIKLGKLIYHYREQLYQETKNEKWKQENFLKDQTGWICSRPTFLNLKKGVPLKNEKKYFQLANRLNKKIKIDSKVDQLLEYYSNLLYEAEIIFDANEIIAICKQAITALTPYKECLYYEEYYRLFYRLERYYSLKDALFTIKEYQHFKAIFDLFDEKMQEVLIYLFMLFGLQNTFHIVEDTISDYHVENNTFLPTKIAYLGYYNIISKYSSIEQYKQLEQEAKALNSLHLISIYRSLMIRYEDLEIEKAYEYADKLENSLQDPRISKLQRNNTIANLGLFYTRTKMPNKAIPFLEETLSVSKTYISSKLIALCFNYISIGKSLDPNLFTTTRIESTAEEVNCLLLQYYQFYHQTNNKEKRALLSKASKLIDYRDNFFRFIIIEEISRLSQIKTHLYIPGGKINV